MSLFVAATLAVCLPGQLFLANATEFPMSFRDALPTLAAAALAGTIVLGLVLTLLPRGTARDIGIAAAFAIGCLAWVQSHLPWPYGIADGHAIDWSAFRRDGAIDVAIWSAGIAAAVGLRRRLVPMAGLAALVLTGVQVSALAIDASRAPHRWIDDVTFDDSGRFVFSPSRNAIILVLDTFQTDVFQELLDEDPSLRERLPGFTYFRNAAAGYPSTAPSVPLILSGRFYENHEPFQRFVRDTYRSASLPKTLTSAGFDVYYHNLYFWPSLYADESIATHVRSKGLWRYDPMTRERAVRLLAFGAFRYLPQPGKRLVAPRIAGLIAPKPVAAPAAATGTTAASAPAAPPPPPKAPSLAALQPAPMAATDAPLPGDGPFFQQLDQNARTTLDRPAFKYFHLWGLHPPLTHDEAFTPMTAQFTRENALRQARGLVKLLDRFVATLKRLGIYDNAAIAILGDHGTSFPLRLVEVDPGVRTHPRAQPVATRRVYALPLVLFKRPGDSAPLRVADTPVTLGDVPQTMLQSLGIASNLPGMSMFSDDIGPRRARRVLFYPPGELRLTERYFPPLREFNISGFSWLEESWRLTGRVFQPADAQ